MFWRKKKDAERLVDIIVTGELKRRETDAILEQQRQQFELRKLEIEMEHLEARGEEQRKERADREKLRQERIQAAARAREARVVKRGGQSDSEGVCKVCRNDKDPTISAVDITWHYNGHREGPSLWN